MPFEIIKPGTQIDFLGKWRIAAVVSVREITDPEIVAVVDEVLADMPPDANRAFLSQLVGEAAAAAE